MRKRILLLVFMLIILSISINARRSDEFSADDAYNWLIQQSANGSYNNNVLDTSAAFLAVDAAGGLTTLEESYIISQENALHCWPQAGCRIKDTIWAVLALHKYSGSSYVTNAESWLKSAQTPTLTGGNWWLEIDTSATGTCTVQYTKGTTDVPKDVEVDAGTFPGCGGKTFFDLKNCLEPGLLNNYASLELNVDCSALGGSAKISIAYNSGSSYYLYEEVSSDVATVTVKNGCFGITYKSSCDYDASLYAEWILSQVGSSLSSELYLRENYDSRDAIHNALLYMITKDKSYAEELRGLQKTDGSWGSNSVKTAFAILALRGESEYSQYVEKAQNWLKDKQQVDGSWEGSVFNTAIVLYSSFYEGVTLPSCNDGIKNQGERGVDCGGPCEAEPYYDDCCYNDIKDEGEEDVDCGGVCDECTEEDDEELICDDDGYCDETRGEDCNNCPGDCLTCEELCNNQRQDIASVEEGVDCGGHCEPCTTTICNNDGICDINLIEYYSYSDNENRNNCPNDCWCGDGVCDDDERLVGDCPQDCGAAVTTQCGDGFCDEGEDITCPEDCGETFCNNNGVCEFELDEDCFCSDCFDDPACVSKGGIDFKWILIILAILILVGGAYFFLTKKGGKQPSYSLYGRGLGPSSRPPEKPKGKGSFFASLIEPKMAPARRPSVGSRQTAKKSKLDEDIEKSIKEAKKLIKE